MKNQRIFILNRFVLKCRYVKCGHLIVTVCSLWVISYTNILFEKRTCQIFDNYWMKLSMIVRIIKADRGLKQNQQELAACL